MDIPISLTALPGFLWRGGEVVYVPGAGDGDGSDGGLVRENNKKYIHAYNGRGSFSVSSLLKGLLVSIVFTATAERQT